MTLKLRGLQQASPELNKDTVGCFAVRSGHIVCMSLSISKQMLLITTYNLYSSLSGFVKVTMHGPSFSAVPV